MPIDSAKPERDAFAAGGEQGRKEDVWLQRHGFRPYFLSPEERKNIRQTHGDTWYTKTDQELGKVIDDLAAKGVVWTLNPDA